MRLHILRDCKKNVGKPYLKNFRVLTNKITYSISENSDYKGVKIKEKNEKYSFCVSNNNKISKRIYLNVYGKHNIYNALACIAVSREIFKLSYEEYYLFV